MAKERNELQKIYIGWLALILVLSGCASVTQDQALKTVTSKYPEALFVYVDAPNDAIASALMAAHLKIASSTGIPPNQ
jgi:PBP1b-binding outer membrane lipoprotein LpoB